MWREWITAWAGSWAGTLLLAGCVLVSLHAVVLQVLSLIEVRRQIQRRRRLDPMSLFEGDPPPVSLLVPAHDEADVIVGHVDALMALGYPAYEIVVVNDGSTDGTLQALISAFALQPVKRTMRARVANKRLRGVYASPHHPQLAVVDVTRGGSKALTLNIALAFSRYPYFCALGAGSILEAGTLEQLVMPFHEDPDTAAVGGVVRPANGCTIERGQVVEVRPPASFWARCQVVEYLRVMLAGRLGWHRADALFIVPGALGMFSRDAVMRVGGYRSGAPGEDLDLATRLQRWAARNGRRRAIRMIATAVCWKRVPERPTAIGRQRARWQQELVAALWENRKLLVSGWRRRLAFLIHCFVEVLGPVIEAVATALFLALLVTGQGHTSYAVFFLTMILLASAVTTKVAISLESVACPRIRGAGDHALLVAYAVAENFVYRQWVLGHRLVGLARGVAGLLARERAVGQAVAEPESAVSAEAA